MNTGVEINTVVVFTGIGELDSMGVEATGVEINTVVVMFTGIGELDSMGVEATGVEISTVLVMFTGIGELDSMGVEATGVEDSTVVVMLGGLVTMEVDTTCVVAMTVVRGTNIILVVGSNTGVDIKTNVSVVMSGMVEDEGVGVGVNILIDRVSSDVSIGRSMDGEGEEEEMRLVFRMKLGEGVITTEELGEGVITTEELGEGVITTEELGEGVIITEELSTTDVEIIALELSS